MFEQGDSCRREGITAVIAVFGENLLPAKRRQSFFREYVALENLW